MIPKTHRIRWSLFLLWGIVVFTARTTSARTLSVGTIGDVPSEEIQKLEPLTQYLQKSLSTNDIDRIKIIVAKSIPQMATLLRQKKVDLYIDEPYPVVAVSRLAPSRLLLQAGKEGSDKCYSVIFVKKDSPFMRLRDLLGEKVAFEQPNSTYGYWLAKNLFNEKQDKLRLVKSASERVRDDEVGYLFSGDDQNTLLWVKKGKVKAGAVDQLAFKREEKNDSAPLRALEKTVSLPARILSIRNDLDPSLSLKIQEVMQGMNRSEEGKEVLKAFEDTPSFEPISRKSLETILQTTGETNFKRKRTTR